MDKQGERRDYESVYLRRTFRDGAKVRNETVANLSMLPAEAIAAIEATLKGQALIGAGTEFGITRSLPHGHVADGRGDGPLAGTARPVGPGVPVTGLGGCADHLPGDSPGQQAVHAVAVGRHHRGDRHPRRGGGLHR